LQAAGEREDLPLQQALGRVLAADVVSPIDVPAHDNSAMDGYALPARHCRPMARRALRSVGTLMAGAPWAGTSAPASACAS
jgi:molybdopterin molybdotransferase